MNSKENAEEIYHPVIEKRSLKKMSGKLSERFQQLKSVRGSTTNIKATNRQARSTMQQAQRGSKINQRRGIIANSNANTIVKSSKKNAGSGKG